MNLINISLMLAKKFQLHHLFPSPPNAFFTNSAMEFHGLRLVVITPRTHAQQGGKEIERSVHIYLCRICKKILTFFYLSKYSLSDAHFNTGRLLFEFTCLQYTLAAPKVFVASANRVSLPSGYRVSIVRDTNIDHIETTPLQYC